VWSPKIENVESKILRSHIIRGRRDKRRRLGFGRGSLEICQKSTLKSRVLVFLQTEMVSSAVLQSLDTNRTVGLIATYMYNMGIE